MRAAGPVGSSVKDKCAENHGSGSPGSPTAFSCHKKAGAGSPHGIHPFV